MIFAVLLHDYPERTKEARWICKQAETTLFARADWFQSLLRANKTCFDEAPGERRNQPFVEALALVQAGTVWQDTLTPLTHEEQLGFEFLQCPTVLFFEGPGCGKGCGAFPSGSRCL